MILDKKTLKEMIMARRKRVQKGRELLENIDRQKKEIEEKAEEVRKAPR